MIPAVVAAIPSLIKLFKSNDKSDAAKDLTKTVVKEASKALGINTSDKKEIIKHLEQNPQDVYKLKKLENDFKIRIKELDLKELELTLEHEQKKEEETSKRWISDNKNGSTFAKLIRPSLVLYLVVISTFLAFADGNIPHIVIKPIWADLFVSLTTSAILAYFGLRTYEKRTNTSKWDSKQKGDK
jgi:hypothetical protein